MQENFRLFPKILFVDSTYKLLANEFGVMIYLVESCNGRGEIAGFGLLANEDTTSINWLSGELKTQNEAACEKIEIIMTDKDLTARAVFSELFPKAKLLLCRFHTLKTFKSQITTSKMRITELQKNTYLDLLQKLVYAESESQYNYYYQRLKSLAPSSVTDYFDINWNSIKNEWSLFEMSFGNYGNFTNNRLESLNQKIKQIAGKRNTLIEFVKSFVVFLKDHENTSSFETAKQFLTNPVSDLHESEENKYEQLLTAYAWKKVKEELKAAEEDKEAAEEEKEVKIDQHSQTPNGIVNIGREAKIVTPLKCECHFYLSMHLPCRHIFYIRNYHKMSCFDAALCDGHWIRQKKTTISVSNLKSVIPEEPKIVKIVAKKPKTLSERRKIFQEQADKMINLASLATGEKFEARVKLIKYIVDKWSENIDVPIPPISPAPHQNDLTECEDVTNVILPANTIIQGRPRGYLQTTASFKKKI